MNVYDALVEATKRKRERTVLEQFEVFRKKGFSREVAMKLAREAFRDKERRIS